MKSFNTHLRRTIIQFSFIFLLLFSSPVLIAQITVTSSDMPSVGDTIRKSNAFTASGIDYTLTGENYNWDFTSLFPIVQSVDTFVSVSSVPFLYQFVFIPNIVANLAQKFPGIDTIPGLSITDPYRFFKNSGSSFTDVGFGFTISDIPLPLKFSSSDVVYKFPLQYGNNADSSFSGLDFGIPDMGFISIDRKRVNKVDGYGTLTTSYGTFEVLRMKSQVVETDSVYIDSISFGTALHRNYTEYKWLGNGYGQPLLQVTEEGPVVTVAWIDSINNPFTAIVGPTGMKNEMQLMPNPVTDNAALLINITDKGFAEIVVYDLAGSRVAEIFSGELGVGDHSMILNVVGLHLRNGIYFIQMKTSSTISTQKLIVE